MKSLIITLLCGVLLSQAGTIDHVRQIRSFFGGKDDKKKAEFPNIVLVGLVEQPVPTPVSPNQQNPYAPPPPIPYAPPQMPYQSPAPYQPPAAPYQPPAAPYQPPAAPYQPPAAPYQPPAAPYQPPAAPYQPPVAPYQPPPTYPSMGYQPPVYSAPQPMAPQNQQPSAPHDGLAGNTDPTLAKQQSIGDLPMMDSNSADISPEEATVTPQS